ncbi:MAG: glycoside hydrolase family 9 protein [Cellulophaga sp.]
MNIKIPGGSFYRNVSSWSEGKLAKDREIIPSNEETGEFNVGYREGGGVVIATLAMASMAQISGEYDNNHYLRTAEDAFEFLEKNNTKIARDGKENIVDDYCALLAAVELYKATNKEVYKKVANKRAQNLMSRLITTKKHKNYWRADDNDRPFFHAADAGYPVVSLLNYAAIVDNETKKEVLQIVRKSMEFEIEITNNVTNPFGYARQYVQDITGKRQDGFFFPHKTETNGWWQGENARIASLASAARLAAQHFPNDTRFANKLKKYALNQLNWVLGLNPYDSSMLEGSGRNNPQYLFYGSYEYKAAPGGIVNGITAGLNNYNDIDFEKGYVVTGKDDDWRWLEQWLPHTSWYLYAVSLKH